MVPHPADPVIYRDESFQGKRHELGDGISEVPEQPLRLAWQQKDGDNDEDKEGKKDASRSRADVNSQTKLAHTEEGKGTCPIFQMTV